MMGNISKQAISKVSTWFGIIVVVLKSHSHIKTLISFDTAAHRTEQPLDYLAVSSASHEAMAGRWRGTMANRNGASCAQAYNFKLSRLEAAKFWFAVIKLQDKASLV